MVQRGKRVGILDADIFGPSIPRLLSLSGEPRTNDRSASQGISHNRKSSHSSYELWIEGYVNGISCSRWKCSCLARINGNESPPTIAPWCRLGRTRCPCNWYATRNWRYSTHCYATNIPGWYRFVKYTTDLGVAIVSTPQDIALIDAVRGIDMFKKVDVPVAAVLIFLKA